MSKDVAKKLSVGALILMIFTNVYGFNNIPRSFFKMGYAAVPWFILSGILFFVPYAFMVAEYGSAFKDEKGGIYSWMARSVGPKYAFVTTFMWYLSYVVWMINVGSGIFVPISNALFGLDRTGSWQLGPLNGPMLLSVLGAMFIILVTFFSSRGLKNIEFITNIGGTAVVVVNICFLLGAIIMLVAHGFHFAEPLSGNAFTTSPNPDYRGIVAMLAFIPYAIFAYGGLEAIGGLVDKTENPEKNFPKGILLASLVIVIGYSLLIFLVGSFANYSELMNWAKNWMPEAHITVSLGNISYLIMSYFGVQLATTFGASAEFAAGFGQTIAHIYGLIMTLSLLGAFFTLLYSPLKQLIEGTPDELWPGKFGEVRESDGMPVNAMWVQCIVVCVIMLAIGFGGKGMEFFFQILTDMSNVSMTLPYVLIAGAFLKFKGLDIKRPFVILKSHSAAMIATIAACGILVVGNFFEIIYPLVAAAGADAATVSSAWVDTLAMAGGPAIFAIVAIILVNRYAKNYPDTWQAEMLK